MSGPLEVIWVRCRLVLKVRARMRRPVLNLGHILILDESVWNDVAFVGHQLTHIEQLMDGLYVGYLVRRCLSSRFRLMVEADAHRVELLHCGGPRNLLSMNRISRSLARSGGVDEDRARMILSLTKGSPL